jgi:hypothetical protein
MRSGSQQCLNVVNSFKALRWVLPRAGPRGQKGVKNLLAFARAGRHLRQQNRSIHDGGVQVDVSQPSRTCKAGERYQHECVVWALRP